MFRTQHFSIVFYDKVQVLADIMQILFFQCISANSSPDDFDDLHTYPFFYSNLLQYNVRSTVYQENIQQKPFRTRPDDLPTYSFLYSNLIKYNTRSTNNTTLDQRSTKRIYNNNCFVVERFCIFLELLEGLFVRLRNKIDGLFRQR